MSAYQIYTVGVEAPAVTVSGADLATIDKLRRAVGDRSCEVVVIEDSATKEQAIFLRANISRVVVQP